MCVLEREKDAAVAHAPPGHAPPRAPLARLRLNGMVSPGTKSKPGDVVTAEGDRRREMGRRRAGCRMSLTISDCCDALLYEGEICPCLSLRPPKPEERMASMIARAAEYRESQYPCECLTATLSWPCTVCGLGAFSAAGRFGFTKLEDFFLYQIQWIQRSQWRKQPNNRWRCPGANNRWRGGVIIKDRSTAAPVRDVRLFVGVGEDDDDDEMVMW